MFRRAPATRLVMVALINVGALVVCLVAAEIFLSTVARLQGSASDDTSRIGWHWSDSPYRAHLLKHGIRSATFWRDDEANQLGVRGRKIAYQDEHVVVVLVGDSHVEAAASRFDDMPEVLLERRFHEIGDHRAKVFSVAASGWSQDQQLLALERYFQRFRADLVIVWHTPNNDFWENAFPDRSTAPVARGAGHLKPVFALTADKTVELVDVAALGGGAPAPIGILSSFNLGSAALQLLLRSGWMTRDRVMVNDRVLTRWLRTIAGTDGHLPVPREACPARTIEVGTLIREYDRYRAEPVTVLTDEAVEESRSHLTPFLDPPSARDVYAIRITTALLHRIKSVVEKNHARLVVVGYDLTFDGMSYLSEIRCVERSGRYFKIDADFFRFMERWRPDVPVLKASVEVSEYGHAGVTVDREDPHLNRFGNTLVIRRLVDGHPPLRARSRQ